MKAWVKEGGKNYLTATAPQIIVVLLSTAVTVPGKGFWPAIVSINIFIALVSFGIPWWVNRRRK